MKKKIFFITLMFVALSHSAMGQSGKAINARASEEGGTQFGYCSSKDTIMGYGSGQADSLSCAILFPKTMTDQVLKGAKITKIRFALNGAARYLNNVSVWITNKLGETNLAKKQVNTVQTGWNEITLDTPYEITDSIYVGYSLRISKIDDYDKDAMPLGITQPSLPNTLFLARNAGKWKDYYSGKKGQLLIQCVVSGGNFKDNAAEMTSVTTNYRTMTGKELTISGIVNNHGSQGIKSIDVSCTINGEKQVVNVPFEGEVNKEYNSTRSFNVTVKSPSTAGYQTMNVAVEKVNGVNNEDVNNKPATAQFINMETNYPRKSVMEEATGTWCGWCPRGMVAIKKMKSLYPDNFIAIALHGDGNANDPMKLADYNAFLTTLTAENGFPSCAIDRLYLGDPYGGTNENPNQWGIEDLFKKSQTRLNESMLSLNAQFADDNKTQITFTTQATFSYDYTGGNEQLYRLAYVLMEDSVTGYTQTNYYSGQTGYGSDFSEFINSKSIMSMAYNEVSVGIYSCYGIEGSISGDIVKGTAKTHSYTITIPERVQNKNHLKVAVLLIDAKNGEIINAQETKIGQGSGIADLAKDTFQAKVTNADGLINIKTNNTQPSQVALYALNGSLIQSASFKSSIQLQAASLKGIYIVRVTSGDQVAVQRVAL